MSKKALAHVSALASIGLQAIEAQKARRVWLDAKARHIKALHDYSNETGESYIGEPHGEPDQEIDESHYARRMAAAESVKQARRLRALINRRLKERT